MIDESFPEIIRNYKLSLFSTRPPGWELTRMRNEVPHLGYKPQISILMPVYNPEQPWLRRALDSVMGQVYPHWELCVCEDGSTERHVTETLRLYERLDDRIKVKYLEENTGIVGATNGALALAGGEFVGLLDHDDELAQHALFEMVRFLQHRPDADLIYSDEDKIDEAGARMDPHIKIGWSPDLALCANYLNHFSVYRRSVLEEVGGWREGFDGAQDLELVQRYGERTDRIYHIPKVLYHWRRTAGSTAMGAESKPYTHERARRAIEDALERRGIAGSVLDGFAPNTFRIEREIIGEPRVSVILPTRGQAPRFVESLRDRTSYPNYELISVDLEGGAVVEHPGDGTPETAERLEGSTFSGLCNAAVRRAGGEHILILDPDLEAVSDGWLERLLQHAQRPEVGAVGGKLYLPSGPVFQAGLLLDDAAGREGTDGFPRFYRYGDRRSLGYRHFMDLTRNCSAVSAACMMFRKSVFEEVGGFDEAHFDGEFADVDLCLRMRERGYLIVYTSYAEFDYHGALPRHSELDPLEADYVQRRWGEVIGRDPLYSPNLAWIPANPFTAGRPSRPSEPDRTEDPSAVGAGASSPPPVQVSKPAGAPVAPRAVGAGRGPENRPLPFFVVGHGRSGTTWLELTLNTHPEMLCKGSGMFFGRGYDMNEKVRSLPGVLAGCENLRIWHDMRANYWSDRTFEEDLPGMVRALADHVMETERVRSGKRLVGDRTPHHVAFLNEVHELYPESKVIHIIRDGRDVAISNVHAFWSNTRDRGGPIDLENEELERRDAYLEDREGFLKSGESIFSESRLDELSSGWNGLVRKGQRDGSKFFGDNYFEIRYESLLDAPHPELKRLFGFLGARRDASTIDRIVEENRFENRVSGRSRGEEDSTSFMRKGIHGDWKGVFNERDKRTFKKNAGDLLVELGYEKDLNW